MKIAATICIDLAGLDHVELVGVLYDPIIEPMAKRLRLKGELFGMLQIR